MFALAPSKQDQSVLRYWARNRYKAHVNGVRYCNRAFSEAGPVPAKSQIRTRPVLMTEDQKSAVIRLTGKSPCLEVLFVPVSRGRARSQTRKTVTKK